jgi:hypothetical protein
MLSDLLESAKTNLIERLSSPVLGSFAAAWCAWNYRFLVILFSDASVSQTFHLIDTVAFPDKSSILLRGTLFPLISAFAYVFLYPYPARFIYEFTLRRQREVNSSRQAIADETPLTLEESRRIRAEFVDRERKNQQVVFSLNEEISALRAQLDNKSQELTPLESDSGTDDESIPLSSSELDVLRKIEEYGGEAMESQIINLAGRDKTHVQFDIGELDQKKLISRLHLRTKQDWRLSLTHFGRKALLESRGSD